MLDPTAFTEWGYLGAVIFLVFAFIWYIDRRDKSYQESTKARDTQWQDFTKQQRAEDNSVIKDLMQQVKELAAQLVSLRDDFNEHNTWERARLEEMAPISNNAGKPRNTQPRK
jgi:hypothetical protein